VVDDHRFLVEAASGAPLSLVYNGLLGDILPSLTQDAHVVIIVCGGIDVTLDMLETWSRKHATNPMIAKSGGTVLLRMDK
jgi:L-serine/L-threonine ammonia-lyase